MAEKILVIGACGQVGTELVENLQNIYGAANVVASDIRKSDNGVFQNGSFEMLNVLDKTQIAEVFGK